MLVKDIMSKNISFVAPDAKVFDAALLMQKHNVGAIPVCENKNIVGIITDRDIVVRNVAHGKDPKATSVKDVMTSKVTTLNVDDDVNKASELMANSKIRRLPVIENNRLVGMVSIGDIATDAEYDAEVSDTLTEISTPSKPE